MRKILVLFAVCISSFISTAQNVGIGVPNPQNKLHVGGGFRLDTLTGVGGAGLVRHEANGVVYGIKFSGNTNDVLRGDGSFGSYSVNGNIGWLLNGNIGTDPTTHFLGTIDNQPLIFRVNNLRHGYLGNSIFLGNGSGIMNISNPNIAVGNGALGKNKLGYGMVAIGDSALHNSDVSFAYATDNTAIGYRSLYNATTGSRNTAIGSRTLMANINGHDNVAMGAYALQSNTSGSSNVAVGYSLLLNTTGSNNTAVGSQALFENTTGNFNTALGYNALTYNTTGSENTAVGYHSGTGGGYGYGTANRNTSVGYFALAANRASENSAVGYRALFRNTIGQFNNAFGAYALESNVSGISNNAFGRLALQSSTGSSNSGFGDASLFRNTTGFNNTAVGVYALGQNTVGFSNTAVGVLAGYSLPNNVSNVTCIGSGTGWNTTLSNHINIGNFSVQWIGGQTGWFHYSDKRIKNDIKDDVPGLAFITRLKPITYHVDIDKQEEIANAGKIETTSELIKPTQKDWAGKYDVEKIKMTGFFAQDVEEAAKAINYSFNGVYNPKNGGLLSLDYSAFVVPLVKAVQEQQKIIEDQNKKIDKQQQQIDLLIKEMQSLKKDMITQKN